MQEEDYHQEKALEDAMLLRSLIEGEGFLYNQSEIFRHLDRCYSGGRNTHLASKICVAVKFLKYEDVGRVVELGKFLGAQYIVAGKKVTRMQEGNVEHTVSCVNAYFHFNTTKRISFEKANTFMKRCGFYAGTGQSGHIWLQYVCSNEGAQASFQDAEGEYHSLDKDQMDHMKRPSKKCGGPTTPKLKEMFQPDEDVTVEPQYLRCKSRRRTKSGRNANKKRVLFVDRDEICTDPKQQKLTNFFATQSH